MCSINNDISVHAKHLFEIQSNCNHHRAVYRARILRFISPLVFYSNVSLKSDERCNHPDRSLRNASGRTSSRATTIPWRLRCGEPIRWEDPYSRKESELDSHTCRAHLFVSSSDALNRIRRDGFAFARVPIHPAKPRRVPEASSTGISTFCVYIFHILLKSTRETWPTLIRGLLDWSMKVLFWIDIGEMSTQNKILNVIIKLFTRPFFHNFLYTIGRIIF